MSLQLQSQGDVYVDKDGVMRWPGNDEEVQGFGINYTVPFAHAYRMAEEMGVDHKKAIDQDIYYFARLGFDLFRVHVWDCEISDTLGNLLENEHLALFDYQLKKMQDRNMRFVLTPIAFWGNGWPERDRETPGFSSKYGKGACLTDESAIKAQENYLFQFLNHINPHTGIAYKDDPTIIAFEVSNEPHHRGEAKEVSKYIKRMVEAMRRTGCKKPIFYNVSHSVHLAQTYFSSGIQGGTFQWYPTGLGAQSPLRGNLLPNVDDYAIPFENVIKAKGGAKLVYEFDAADVASSYLYPAMARSFREAGIQIATHFSWDPTFLAPFNTEYNTHFMNLLYTPQKALSLMISGEVFRQIPMYQDFGSYPFNTKFGPFRVDHNSDLAELVSDEKFIYTNHTGSIPEDLSGLKLIAGYGNSPLVEYEGKGAYFLDKVEEGVWRLEVMPDAIRVHNPFGRNSPKRKLAELCWREWKMRLNLPGMDNFTVRPVNAGNNHSTEAENREFAIVPGVYLLIEEGQYFSMDHTAGIGNLQMDEYFGGPGCPEVSYFLHTPPAESGADKSVKISATILSAVLPERVELVFYGSGWRPWQFPMEEEEPYIYTAHIPDTLIRHGFARYYISVHRDDQVTTRPGPIEGHPFDWDFTGREPYEIRIVEPAQPICLFDAREDAGEIRGKWVWDSGLLPSNKSGKAGYKVNVEKLFVVDPENPNAEPVHDHSFRFNFQERIAGRKDDLGFMNKLILKAWALNDKPCTIQLGLVMNDGAVYGKQVTLQPKEGKYTLPLSELHPVKMVTLPRPYPTFLPYCFEPSTLARFEIGNIEAMQVSIGPGIPEDELDDQHGLVIESLYLLE